MTIGWKAMFWKSGEQPNGKLTCPECKMPADFSHRTRMHFFHVLGIPLFPVSGKRRIYRCGICKTDYRADKVNIAQSMEAGALIGGEQVADA